MDVNDTIVERCCAGCQIEIPHPDELLIKHFLHFVEMLQLIFSPAAQRSVIVKSQILNIHRVEIMLRHSVHHLTQTWNCSARKDIFLDPCITRMLFQSTDEVQKEKPAFLHHLIRALKEEIVVVTAYMLYHTHTDHTVKLFAQLRQIAIVHKFNIHIIFQSFRLDPVLALFILLFTQCDSCTVYFIFLCRPVLQGMAAHQISVKMKSNHALLSFFILPFISRIHSLS